MPFLQPSRFALLAGVFKCSISVRSVFQCIFLDSNSSDVNQQPGLGVVTWVSKVVFSGL